MRCAKWFATMQIAKIGEEGFQDINSINIYYDRLKLLLDNLFGEGKLVYFRCCLEEAPTTKRFHSHIFMVFNTNWRRNTICNYFRKVHLNIPDLEPVKGTNEQVANYLSKSDENNYEKGICPVMKKKNWKEVMNKVQDMSKVDLMEQDRWSFIHIRGLMDYKSEVSKKKIKNTYGGNLKHKNIMIMGESGFGKTSTIRSICNLYNIHLFNKEQSKWFNRDMETCDPSMLLIDDIGESFLHEFQDQLKSWTDRWSNTVEIKGWCFTSNYNIIDSLLHSREDTDYLLEKKAFLRRFTCLYCTTNDVPLMDDNIIVIKSRMELAQYLSDYFKNYLKEITYEESYINLIKVCFNIKDYEEAKQIWIIVEENMGNLINFIIHSKGISVLYNKLDLIKEYGELDLNEKEKLYDTLYDENNLMEKKIFDWLLLDIDEDNNGDNNEDNNELINSETNISENEENNGLSNPVNENNDLESDDYDDSDYYDSDSIISDEEEEKREKKEISLEDNDLDKIFKDLFEEEEEIFY